MLPDLQPPPAFLPLSFGAAMAPAILPSLLFCLVLLVSPYPGCSYHTRYTHGGKYYVIRSNRAPRQPKQTPTCRRSSSDGVPVLHRLSPCSPHGGTAARSQETTTSVADVLHRDALRLRSLFGDKDNRGAAPAPAPSAAGGGGVSIHTKGDPIETLPGAFEYHVAAGFGTPVQEFAVGIDTLRGATLLKCTPCAASEPSCGDAFDHSASSTLSQVPCGSPDCPFHRCSGPSCTFSMTVNNTVVGNATFLTDTLTLTSSTTLDNFRFACLEVGFLPNDNSTGVLDLSRNSHSLASRAPAYHPGTVAFSYCLPSSPDTVGFLSIAAPRPELSGRKPVYTPLRTSPYNGNLYVVDLVGLGLGGPDLSAPPTAFAGDTLLDVHTTFTYLRPEAYAALRDGFQGWMAHYPAAPPMGKLETCYNFTGLDMFIVPVVTLRFAGGGADVDLSMDEMMYFTDPDSHFSVGCLAFVAAPEHAREAAVVGNRAQASTEVMYDVRGGYIGFVPYRC